MRRFQPENVPKAFGGRARWGTLQRSPDPWAGFIKVYVVGTREGGREEGTGGMEGRRGKKGRDGGSRRKG